MFWFHHGALADDGSEAATCHRIAIKPSKNEILNQRPCRSFYRARHDVGSEIDWVF
jgi:hypothetical protein